MTAALQFVFASVWHFLGSVILLTLVFHALVGMVQLFQRTSQDTVHLLLRLELQRRLENIPDESWENIQRLAPLSTPGQLRSHMLRLLS